MTNTTADRFFYKKSKINQLRGFCQTVQADCSARKAALKLGLEPATITLQIRSLEEDLGIKLFTRTKNNRFEITSKGQKFYEIAIVQLQGMESLFNNFREKLVKDNKNSLIIASYSSALTYVLPKYIKILLENKTYKKIKIKICNINIKDAFERMRDKSVDFAFYPSIKNGYLPAEIKKENIFKFKNTIVVHKNHPLAQKRILKKIDIEKYNFISKDKYTFFNPKKSINFKLANIEFENVNNYTILGFVKEDIAIGACGAIYKNEKRLTNQNIIFKNIDYLYPEMFYSIFTLKNTILKKSALFVINTLKKDSDL